MIENIIERTARLAFESSNPDSRWSAIDGWERKVWLRQGHLQLWREEMDGLVRNWSVGRPE